MFLNYKFISKNIALFHSLLSFYIAFGFLLSEGHQKLLIGLIPTMYGNWLMDDNKCIFTRLEDYFSRSHDKKEDDNKDDDSKPKLEEQGFITRKINSLGIPISNETGHKITVLVGAHTFIQCYFNVIISTL